jgi:hypothetical protein
MEPFTPSNTLYPNIKLVPKVAVGFDYRIDRIILFDSLRIFVALQDDRGQTIDTRVLLMDGEDYKAWGTDDAYVVSWIKKQLLKS